MFEFNGEQFTIFHLNSGPEAPPKKKDADLSSIRSPNLGTLLVNNSEGIENNSANQISAESMNRKLRQKGRARSPIIIVNTKIAATSFPSSVITGGKDTSNNFIEVYNLAKHLV